MSIQVFCPENGMVYASLKEAAEKNGTSVHRVKQIMAKKSKSNVTFQKAHGWKVRSWGFWPISSDRHPSPQHTDPEHLVAHCRRAILARNYTSSKGEDVSASICAYCVRRKTMIPCPGRQEERVISLDDWREANNNDDSDEILLNTWLRRNL